VGGVQTGQGPISCRVVVNAAGAWAGEVGRWVGVEVPVTPLARCIWVTRPFPDIPSDRPFVEDVSAEWYCRPEGPGVLIGMGKVPTEQFDIRLENSLLGEMIERAIHRLPVLEKAAVQTSWTGIRPVSRDGLPILGPVPGVTVIRPHDSSVLSRS
jgi:sarcosine oxidase subunit beta